VSHDRYLLDRLVGKIVEISDKKAHVYPGNYSNYRREKKKRLLELERRYQQNLEFVERTRDFIARNKDREGMRKTARGRKKRLNRLLREKADFLEKPQKEKKLGFRFRAVEAKSSRLDTVLTCRNLTKRFGKLVLFEDLSIELFTGQRLGIIGPNGTGKTTFLKLALGAIEPTAGLIKLKDKIAVGYLGQAGVELNSAKTVLEEAAEAFTEKNTEKLRGLLGAFLFTGDDVFKRVGDLSGGERSRLALCKLVLSGPELLVLDEPTNHLDIAATEALEEALQEYDGTILVVSHDRFFLDHTVDQLLALGVDETGSKAVGRHELVLGSYSRYNEILEERAAHKIEQEKTGKGRRPKRPRQSKPERKTTPPELRQFNRWSIERIEKEITEIEEQIEKLQEQFGDERTYKNKSMYGKLQRQFDEKRRYLDLLYRAHEWRSK
jgi:ATP-binding cassette subfamily F protein 3